MAEGGYFIRMRGCVSGPYDVPSLRLMVQRGALPRFYEVSRDGLRWSAAGDVAELFQSGGPAPGVASRAVPPPLPAGGPGRGAAPGPSPAAADDLSALSRVAGNSPADGPEPRYYYRHAGVTVGPVPLQMLRSLAHGQRLDPDDAVWAEGQPPQASVPARVVPGLALSFVPARPGMGVGQKVALVVTCAALLSVPLLVFVLGRCDSPGEAPAASQPATAPVVIERILPVLPDGAVAPETDGSTESGSGE